MEGTEWWSLRSELSGVDVSPSPYGETPELDRWLATVSTRVRGDQEFLASTGILVASQPSDGDARPNPGGRRVFRDSPRPSPELLELSTR